MPKRSRLAVKNVQSGFQNRKLDKKSGNPMFLTKWPPNLAFYHSKTEHKKCLKNDRSNTGRSGIRWVTVKSIYLPKSKVPFLTVPEGLANIKLSESYHIELKRVCLNSQTVV
jgi:hypothetical protein